MTKILLSHFLAIVDLELIPRDPMQSLLSVAGDG